MMKITFQLTPEDALSYRIFYIFKKSWNGIFIALMVVLLLSLNAALFIFKGKYSIGSIIWALLIPLLLYGSWSYAAKKLIRAFGGDMSVEIRPEGIYAQGSLGDGLRKWQGVKEIAETKKHIYFILLEKTAYVVPKRAFASLDEAQRFLNEASTCWKQANPSRGA